MKEGATKRLRMSMVKEKEMDKKEAHHLVGRRSSLRLKKRERENSDLLCKYLFI